MKYGFLSLFCFHSFLSFQPYHTAERKERKYDISFRKPALSYQEALAFFPLLCVRITVENIACNCDEQQAGGKLHDHYYQPGTWQTPS